MTSGTRSLKGLRRGNKAAVLFLLMREGELSRIRIAAKTGLTGASVTQLCKELISEGLVEESGEVTKSVAGRRETLLRFAGERIAAVGVNIESDNTHVSLCTWNEVLAEEIYPTQMLFERGIDKLNERIAELASACGGRKFVGVGIAASGIADERSGVSVTSYGILPDGLPLAAKVREGTGCEVSLINNVRAQARALITGCEDDFMLVKHGPGVGCAVISDGAVVSGADGKAGELGHTVAEEGGFPCRCGKRGCLETCVSEARITELYAIKTGDKVPVREIYGRFGKDDAATEIIGNCLNRLAVAIGNAAALLNPRKVLVTGGIFAGEDTFAAFRAAVEKAGFGGAFPLARIGDERKVKAFSGARHIMLARLLGI